MLAPVLACIFTLSVPADVGDDRYQFIAGLAERGLQAEVVREARRFLEEHGGHGKADLARYRLATALFDLNRAEEARPHFTRLAKVRGFEFQSEVLFRHGQCELEAGEHDVATGAFERVLAGDGDYLRPAATFLLGESHFRAERFDQAEARYAATLRLEDAESYAADALHGMTWCAYRLGNHDQAIQRAAEFTRAHARDERVQELAFVTGESHLELDRPAPALVAYKQVSTGAFHAAAMRGAGFACAALDDHAGAVEYFGKVLELDGRGPYAPEAALHRGIHQLRLDQARAALESLELPIAGKGPEVQYWRGRSFAKLGDHQQALAAFEAGSGQRPDERLAQRLAIGRADALFELGRTDEAAAVYEAAGSDYALHAAAVAKLNDGEAAEAVRLAAPLANPAKDSEYRLEATLTVAEGQFALERYAAAEAAFAVVADQDQDAGRRARAISRLGWCRFLTDDPVGARAHFERVLKEFGQSAEAVEARFLAGRSAEDAGDAAAAAEHYRRYLGLESKPHAEEASLRLARFEDPAAAEARLARLIQDAPASSFAPQARFDLAERQASRGEWQAARTNYAAFLAEHGGHELADGAAYGLAWSLYELQEFGLSLAACERLSTRRGAEADLVTAALELAVWSARKAALPERAARALRVLLPRLGDDGRRLAAARVAGSAFSDAQRYKEADAMYGLLLEHASEPGVIGSARVECIYLALDRADLDAAEACAQAAQRVIPKDPELCEAWFFVGEAFFAAEQDARATAAYAQAAQSSEPEVASRALYKGGYTALRQERYRDSAARFAALVEGHPRSELFGESLFLLGESHYRAGDYEAAVPALERLRKEAPRHSTLAKGLFRLGVARTRLEHWREGAETLGVLAKRFPEFPHLIEAELWRGRALAGMDQPRGARAAFERVAEGDRGILAAQANIELGRLHLAAGERNEALSKFLYVSVLFAHDEEVAEALYLAGQVLESRGDAEDAKERYLEAIEDHPQAAFTQRCKDRMAQLGG